MNPIIKNTYIGIGLIVVAVVSFLMLLLLKHFVAAFFVLVVFVSLIVYFAKKFKINFKSHDQVIQDLKHRNLHIRDSSADIHIDDIKNNPELKKKILKQGYPLTNRPSAYERHHSKKTSHQEKISQVSSSNCSNCGTPLTKTHKFCPSCGSRLS